MCENTFPLYPLPCAREHGQCVLQFIIKIWFATKDMDPWIHGSAAGAAARPAAGAAAGAGASAAPASI